MSCIAEWTLPPRVRNVAVITAGVDAICHMNGFSRHDSGRLQVALEGIFAYCVRSINSKCASSPIRVRLYWKDLKVSAEIEYYGPGGDLDDMLKRDSKMPLRRTSFEAMGLFIARDLVETLSYSGRFDLTAGGKLNSYVMEYTLARNDEDFDIEHP